MKIMVIGATGMAGSAIVQLALQQQHQVIAVGRNQDKLENLRKEQATAAQLTLQAQNAFTLTKADLQQVDVVVDCFATAPEQAYLHVDLATHLVAELRECTQPRLVFILGAGSLLAGSDQHLHVHDLEKLPGAANFIAVPQNQLAELQFLQTVKNVNWVGISPSDSFEKGPTRAYQLGQDQLLVNAAGESVTTSGTMAEVVMQEISNPQHHQERFTVVNQ
ncbi:NAD(P)H-binding protein [Lactobacillus sp. DCY120]|uniref:NAD(P)H-binding protein n=1 Tax=Bombilactobacillus apium TaxID=2675299 RepID=A0A850R193_9LACO|nr:NAD(P)H-binding protein [Bombilactobacillus apium]NVY95791.1 NAD(P)H-binding protein [Bombilactobacillus apium]